MSAARRTVPPPGAGASSPGMSASPAVPRWPAGTSRLAPGRPGASSSETLSSRAADSLPRTTAVGLLSPRSILLIIARDTPDASASRSIDQPRPCRSRRRRSPNASRSSTIVDMDPLYKIRPAAAGDAEAIRAIRNDVIEHSTAMWTTKLLTADDGRAWMAENLARRSAYAVETAGDVIGFASWSPWRPKDGYRHTVEDSLYLLAGHQGRGIG